MEVVHIWALILCQFIWHFVTFYWCFWLKILFWQSIYFVWFYLFHHYLLLLPSFSDFISIHGNPYALTIRNKIYSHLVCLKAAPSAIVFCWRLHSTLQDFSVLRINGRFLCYFLEWDYWSLPRHLVVRHQSASYFVLINKVPS